MSKDLNDMVAWEQGELDFNETVDLFQRLINSGMVWQLQGMYGRTAVELIKRGYCEKVTA